MADKTEQPKGALGAIGSALKDSGVGSRLADEAKSYLQAKGSDLVGNLGSKLDGLTEDLEQGGSLGAAAADGLKRLTSGDSPMKAATGAAMTGAKEKIKSAFGGGGGGGGGKVKMTSIVEDIDVGVPVRVAYNQWTQFGDFPGFMKKVESAEQESEEKVNWKAQIFWSHRTWEATIKEQVPDDRIVWESKGAKGHVDGSVTFHELAPRLTRILLVLEYHPQGLFERTGNIWRAQGRRARLELKHFRRHVMTQTILDGDEVEGWRGEIRDSEVVTSHEDALEQEQQEPDDEQQDVDAGDDTDADEYDDEEADAEEDDDEDYDDEDEYDEDDEEDYDDDEDDEDDER